MNQKNVVHKVFKVSTAKNELYKIEFRKGSIFMLTRGAMLFNTVQQRLSIKFKAKTNQKKSFVEGLRNEVCLTVK